MKRRLITRYTVVSKDGDTYCWGTCPRWFAGIPEEHIVALGMRRVIDRVAWIGTAPVCNMFGHNH